ncbi:MAG: 16S rRNA (guanine(966)-N(2))-methyltransferase RsmD, partial [Eubacterium sp.]|nr:16S rRNA (guanine(966)-N(2))-methyltransferase RsmD [Eubacterium sp.]
VITGSARGRRLETLNGEEVTRPTAESVKEALFSMIQFEIEDKRVLDLFAGSGQLGIEALSRGASFCTFVENNRKAESIVKTNVENCGFSSVSQVVLSDAVAFLSRINNFDVAFLDPPYNKGLIEKCMPSLVNLMSEDGIIVCETSKEEKLPESFSDFSIVKERNYGKTKITIYRKGLVV